MAKESKVSDDVAFSRAKSALSDMVKERVTDSLRALLIEQVLPANDFGMQMEMAFKIDRKEIVKKAMIDFINNELGGMT